MASTTALIRPMAPKDLPAVVAIESESHHTPWTQKIFTEELEREWARLVVAAVPSGQGADSVVAFCNYWLVADELHLLNICCGATHRRRGFAGLLMDHTITLARQRECRLITLEVRTSNAAAIAMYERYEFEGSGVRPGYYGDNKEDALVMLLHLESEDQP
ncbi:MAG: ribosomal protein S18-alanine N-acetyltransferase [Myxococcales bacterium]|nr:ribosomal protein S18-alanine N-acetyltransferase [Myxococcales bacterium]